LLSEDEYIIVSNSVASIYKKPTFTSELVTQALIWEKLIVIEKKTTWYKVKQNDDYIGWIHSFYIINSNIYNRNKTLHEINNWYWVKDKFLQLKYKNNQTYFLSYGSLIPCFKEDIFFTLLPNNDKLYLDESSVINYNDKSKFKKYLLESMQELIGTPYLWGGKSSYGFDCSGLVQSILKVTKNIFLPRDASMQISSKLLKVVETSKIGDLIFFKENNRVVHVGIYINDIDFMHSSGFVKINSINKKSKYYCEKLEVNYYKTYRIID